MPWSMIVVSAEVKSMVNPWYKCLKVLNVDANMCAAALRFGELSTGYLHLHHWDWTLTEKAMQ